MLVGSSKSSGPDPAARRERRAAFVSSLDAGKDHFLKLDASLVATQALLETRENLEDGIAERAMICVYGDSGLGKTVSVNAVLRLLAPERTLRVQFRSHPYPRDIREVLFRGLGLPGQPPRYATEFDMLLKRELSRTFRVLVCDEAQWLSTPCFELWRHLWDDDETQIMIVFVGGNNCYEVLRDEPMLASRIFSWQEFERLTSDEVAAIIPVFHPIWRDADPADIALADERLAHGNFRAWAKVTVHAKRALQRLDRDSIDREVLRWVFKRIGRGK